VIGEAMIVGRRREAEAAAIRVVKCMLKKCWSEWISESSGVGKVLI
jgi:hypothetical protein